MKKLFTIMLVALLFIGCSNDEKKKENESASGSGNISEENLIDNTEIKDKPFDLTYKFPKGQKLSYSLTSISTTNQTIETDTVINQEVNQTIDYLFDLESLGKVEANFKLNVFIKSVRLRTKFNEDKLEYNSEKIDTSVNVKDFAEYASLAKTSYQVVVDPQGRIVEVDNVNDIIDNYIKIQEVPSITAEERTQFGEQIKYQVLQPLTQQVFKYMPQNKVRIDSTWTLNYTSSLGVYELKNSAVSTFNGIQLEEGDSLAVIKTDLNVVPEGNGDITQNDIHYQFTTPKITGFSTLTFNFNRGYVVKSESTAQTEMNLMVTGNTPDAGQQTAKRTDLSVNKNYLELLRVE